MPALAGLISLLMPSHSIGGNKNTLLSISDTPVVASATGNRFLIHIERHKIRRICRFALVLSFSAHFPEAHVSFQIVRDSRRLGSFLSSSQFTPISAFLPKKIVNRLLGSGTILQTVLSSYKIN